MTTLLRRLIAIPWLAPWAAQRIEDLPRRVQDDLRFERVPGADFLSPESIRLRKYTKTPSF